MKEKRSHFLFLMADNTTGSVSPRSTLPQTTEARLGETEDMTFFRSSRQEKPLLPLTSDNGNDKKPTAFWSRSSQQFQLRWIMLSRKQRIVFSVIVSILAANLLVFSLDLCFGHYRVGTRFNSRKGQEFAVVINTYKRPEMLKQAIHHYSHTCGPKQAVAKVYVVWAELDQEPPSPPPSTANTSPVQFIRVAKDSLNSRFLPIDGLEQDAIFMVDDDISVDCGGLRQGFAAWQAFPNSMVGYYPRLAMPQKRTPDEYTYHSWPIVFARSRFNMILTKACFLHRRYMELYSDATVHPPAILDYVDQHKNCEDVAMSMLVANVTSILSNHGDNGLPIYVETWVSDKGLFGGISTGSGHMGQRSQCLTDISRIYKQAGWKSPFADIGSGTSLADGSWFRHVPRLFWLYRPSNFFEWFALGNVLK